MMISSPRFQVPKLVSMTVMVFRGDFLLVFLVAVSELEMSGN